MARWHLSRIGIQATESQNDVVLVEPFRNEMSSTVGTKVAQLPWR